MSKQTEYGLRAVVHLARLGPRRFVQSRDLATQDSLPNKFLEAILLTLRRGGFLESKVGRDGGYRLTRPARDISVGDLVRTLEGRMAPHESRRPEEMSSGEAVVNLLNEKLTAAADDALDCMTLEDLLEQANKAASMQQQMYYI